MSGIIYVNASVGNDSNEGIKGAPKATIASALNRSGDLEIVIEESANIYNMPKLGGGGRNIVIRPSGNVVIRGN